MTVEQLLNELKTVAPADADEWRDLRAKEIGALSAADNARVYAQWRKLAALK